MTRGAPRTHRTYGLFYSIHIQQVVAYIGAKIMNYDLRAYCYANLYVPDPSSRRVDTVLAELDDIVRHRRATRED